MRDDEFTRKFAIALIVTTIVWIGILCASCIAVIDALAAPNIIMNGQYVENVVDINEAPPINDISVVLDDVDTLQQPELEYLGVFRCTYYCSCSRCNGRWGAIDGYGNPLVWGTVAVDPKVIPLQTHLVIDGYDMEFVARDTGGKWVQGNHIDIYVPVSHSEALRMAQGEKLKVWKIK